MNKNCKYIFSRQTLGLMLLLCVSLESFAYDFEVDGLCYNILSGNQAEVTYKYLNGNSYSGNLFIPEKVNYNGKTYNVVSIGNYAFNKCSNLTGQLTIPNSIKSIGYRAFYNCSGFTGQLIIPNSVTSIGQKAFEFCTGFSGSLIISNSITFIDNNTFYGCSGFTGTLTIPNSITSIGEDAFNGCSGFTGTLIIPNSVTSIGNYAFNYCTGLNGPLKLSNSLTSIGDFAFGGCENLCGELVIPNSVTTIGTHAFANCKGFTGSLTISSKLILVDNHTFSGCSGLQGTLIIPNSVTSIGDYAFYNCKGLNGFLKLSNSLTSIGNFAFGGCENLCGELVIPNSVTTIGTYAFANCKRFTGPLTIPNKLTLIDNSTFYGCSGFTGLLEIPNTVKEIGDKAFSGCKGFSGLLNLPDSVKSIGKSAFSACSGFDKILIPKTVESIGSNAFNMCSNVTKVISLITTPFEIEENVLELYLWAKAILYIPKNTKSSYSTYSGWMKNFKDVLEFDSNSKYKLSISSFGNGRTTYEGNNISQDIAVFDVYGEMSATLTFKANEGYQVKSVKVNGTEVSISNNSYTISNITKNTTVEVEFEEIPINSAGWYNTYITCINRTESKIVTGSLVQKTVGFEITNSGNRSVNIKKLVAKHPDTNATLTTSTDMSLLGELKPDSTKALSISLRVDVSPIYEITYTVDSEEYVYDNTQYIILSIIGNKFGVVKFMEASVGVDLKKFSIKPGDNATIEFMPNNGCVLTKATVKDTDITSNIVGSKYTIANITSSTSVNAVFDGVSGDSRSINGHEYVDLGLPSGKYWSTVNYGAKNPEDAGSYSSVHNLGTVSSEWGEYWISPTKDDMQELLDMCEWNWSELNGKKGFIIKGPNGNTMFLPAAGMHYSTYYSSVGTLAYYCTSTHDDYSRYCVFKGDTSEKEFMLESGLLNQYSVRPISTLRNESVFSVDGLHFSVISDSEKTVSLAKGNYGKVLEVPATVKYPSTEWKIVGIDKDALSECNELAAIIWNPDAVFTESVDNPNLLLYVKSADYAPTTIKNVVVNGVADRITLIDASGKNDYYCPQEFTAKEISYTHNYKMETGLGSARGWETIALPFDVQKVTHESKGEIIPFANRKSGDAKKHFWLMTYGANGWTEATNIKANTPYIISMPNHSNYKSEFRLDGRVTFSAENVTMPTSDNLNTTAYNGKTFIPNYTNQSNKNFYALNVNNDLETYSGSDVEGSIFLIGDMVDRVIHPFEAYMTSVSQTRGYIAIDEDLATSIGDISEISAEESPLNIYNLNGQLIRTVDGQSLDEIQKGLPAGVYIVNGMKIIIR